MRVLALILLASAVAACGGRAESDPPPAVVAGTQTAGPEASPRPEARPAPEASPRPEARPAPEASPRPEASPCRGGETKAVGTPARAYAAVVRKRTVAFRAPGRGGFATFGTENMNGVAMVLSVRAKRVDAECEPRWYRVQLPLKPNGVTGWVRAGDVELTPVTTRIVVDLSDRSVTLFDRGREVISTRAAIGAAGTPTPTGSFYVNQRLVPADPTGPFGPGAIGISAFSEVLTGWTQGGPIAIHGTNRPDLIGGAVSNGCIRVRNADLRRLFDRALAGTPVTVRA